MSTDFLPPGYLRKTGEIVIDPKDAGKPVELSVGGVTLKLPTMLGLQPIERPAPWGDGPRPTSDFPASVHGVLKKLSVKTPSGVYAVSDPELLAAKKNLMQYWGLAKYLKPDGSNLKFDRIKTESGLSDVGVTPNGFFYGTLTTDAGRVIPFDLNVYAEPKPSKASIDRVVGYFETDKKA